MDDDTAARIVESSRGHLLHPLYQVSDSFVHAVMSPTAQSNVLRVRSELLSGAPQTASWREEWSESSALLDCFLLFGVSAERSEHLQLKASVPAQLQDPQRMVDNVHMLVAEWVDTMCASPESSGEHHIHFFAATNADGAKKYLFCLLSADNLLVATSAIPNFEFAHSVLSATVELLETGCPYAQLSWMLSCLVRLTPQPLPGVRYELEFPTPHGTKVVTSAWDVDFLCNEDPFLAQCLDVLTADMLVCAYASMLLEHRLLVVSSATAVLPLVCELFLSLLSPLQWPHVFVPVLARGMHHVIESPCPYVMGIASLESLDSSTDLEGVTIINIDRGTTTVPRSVEKLPQSVEDDLVQRVGEVMVRRCRAKFSRPTSHWSGQAATQAECSRKRQLAEIREAFIHQTLRLICARHCTVSAFYRSKYGEMFGVERLQGKTQHNPNS